MKHMFYTGCPTWQCKHGVGYPDRCMECGDFDKIDHSVVHRDCGPCNTETPVPPKPNNTKEN